MLRIWIATLLGFFAFAVDEPATDPAANPDSDAPDPQSDLDLGGVDDDPALQGDPEPEDPKAALAEERKARQAAEARAQQFEREMSESRSRAAPQQSEDQRIHAAEEERLRSKDVTDLERWQIEANRKLRAGTSASSAALFEARDLADRSSFRQLEITKPALYKRYASRVEEELVKARKGGSNVPREAILRFLIGNDALDGKLATKKKPATDPTAASGINRGKLPGARSDTRGKNPMSEREKRRERLANVQI